jgi:hypothetical protein
MDRNCNTRLALLVLGAAIIFLGGCSLGGAGDAAASFAPACQPFDPDVTHSCLISSERWSEIAEVPEPPGKYRYCAWPGLLSGDYRTRYRGPEGAVHDFTDAPAQTPSFLLQARRGTDNSASTEVVDYRLIRSTQPCPNSPPR